MKKFRGWEDVPTGSFLLDEEGRVVGEVKDMIGPGFLAVAEEQEVGRFLYASDAKSAVEKRINSTLFIK